jgi:hypothetical protein
MNIGMNKIIISKNINQVRSDFLTLTENNNLENTSQELKIFYGCINGNNFIFSSGTTSRLATPVFKGELIEKNNDQTIITIKIVAPIFNIFINISLVIIYCYILIPILVKKWHESSIYLNLFLIILGFFIPVVNFFHYFYYLKIMKEDFYLYAEGYYDKYL